MTPLVDQLHHFCMEHESATGVQPRRGDDRPPATHLARAPGGQVESDPDERRDAEESVLGVICDIAAVADVLLAGLDLERKPAWSRANPILDLERYTFVVEGQDSWAARGVGRPPVPRVLFPWARCAAAALSLRPPLAIRPDWV